MIRICRECGDPFEADPDDEGTSYFDYDRSCYDALFVSELEMDDRSIARALAESEWPEE